MTKSRTALLLLGPLAGSLSAAGRAQPPPTAEEDSPSGRGALAVGQSCCAHGGGIDLLGVGRALARGADRILHPD